MLVSAVLKTVFTHEVSPEISTQNLDHQITTAHRFLPDNIEQISMNATFKKVMGCLSLLLIGASVSAQQDSTDLDFYAEEYVPLTLEDSLNYGVEGYHAFKLEFDLPESSGITKIRVEVISVDYEFNERSVFLQSYTIDQLADQNLLIADHVQLGLGAGLEGYTYRVFLILEDNLGHEKLTITKYLAE